jgi:hypothetical protein
MERCETDRDSGRDESGAAGDEHLHQRAAIMPIVGAIRTRARVNLDLCVSITALALSSIEMIAFMLRLENGEGCAESVFGGLRARVTDEPRGRG